MREVAVLGIGQTPVSEHWDKSLLILAGEAVFAALEDAGRESAEAIYVGNMLSGMLDKQEQLGAMIADWVGTTRGWRPSRSKLPVARVQRHFGWL